MPFKNQKEQFHQTIGLAQVKILDPYGDNQGKNRVTAVRQGKNQEGTTTWEKKEREKEHETGKSLQRNNHAIMKPVFYLA